MGAVKDAIILWNVKKNYGQFSVANLYQKIKKLRFFLNRIITKRRLYTGFNCRLSKLTTTHQQGF